MELVPVTTVNDAGLANIILGVLEQAGVEAVIHGGDAGDVSPMPSVNPFQVLVGQADLSRARDVLAQFETTPEDAEDDE